jgi:hypothetical protein
MKHGEFTARTELKSLTRSIKCVETECGDLELLSECLDSSSNSCLLSGGATDSPVHHRTATVHVRCAISFLFWRSRPLQLRAGWCTGHCPVHTGQTGAPCRELARATRRPWIARPTVALAAIGSPDSPVNYSRTPPNFPESGMFTGVQPGAPDTVRCTTGQSGVPN